ncbi:MAG: chemotaxis protein CheA [Heliobacteriaceae bacterium]|nr:chemotaxis protein CheA [Heliobacteriaceae bacterium]MDD4587227.1 chemotaxis protein CheA [Heliobacteriaceae bacterium]
MDTTQYMDVFMEESREHLQTLNQKILELENNSREPAVLDEIFRSAHTLKGMSATMGFERIAELTHEMENVLSNLRGTEIRVNTQIIDLLFKCLDALENMVEAIAGGDSDTVDITGLVGLLRQSVLEDSDDVEAFPKNEAFSPDFSINQYDLTVLHEAERKDFCIFHIRIDLDSGCIMKAARAYMVFRKLEEFGEIVKSVPAVPEIEDEQFDLSFQVLFVAQATQEVIHHALESIAEVRVGSLALVNLNDVQPSTTTRPGVVESGGEDTAAISEQPFIPNEPGAGRSPATGAKLLKANQTVRVDIERLDVLMNLVGELVINKTRLDQIAINAESTDLSETIEHIDRITIDLQNVVMKVRMVPIEQVFNRFPRMVRDMAKELGKEINLIIEGKETELDRTVIDEIGDPLVHLLRNAIDHGVEKPETRRQNGKPVEAIIRLVAKHEGNHVVIEVEDDGRGINPEAIRAKSVKKGLIAAKEAEQLDDQGAIDLIWKAGFSMAETVSDISGRGVGLDVVRNKIESLNGSIDIQTQVGKGTMFKVRLPLTLAIIQALLVNVGKEIYAIPLSTIDETTSIQPGQINNVQNQEVVLLRGKVLPLVRLHQVLAVSGEENTTGELFVVVVRKGNNQAGLIVDSLIGQQDIVIKSAGKLLQGIPGIAGATILGNGDVSLILDIGTLF